MLIGHHGHQATMLEILLLYLGDAFGTLRILKVWVLVDCVCTRLLVIQLIKRLFLLINRMDSFLILKRSSWMTVFTRIPSLLCFHLLVRWCLEGTPWLVHHLEWLLKVMVLFEARNSDFLIKSRAWLIRFFGGAVVVIIVYLSLTKLLHHLLTISLHDSMLRALLSWA